ncbi:MAG: hypothetical protein IJ298_01600 [Ruminococcus sp.]|nr:hypothetical protein [Ruminococcus sp.]
MKRVVSIIVALLLMCCAVASVSAEISPTASTAKDQIVIDAIPVPDVAGNATPDINNPGKVEINSGEVITLTATPKDGYKFSHWEFVFGEFDIIEGSITSSTIVIKPTGNEDVRAYAHFVEEGKDVTVPSSGTIPTPDDGPISPTTGENTAVYAACASMLVVAIAVVAVIKRKQTA